MSWKKKSAYGLLIALVIMQFIRPTRNSALADTPNDITHVTSVSPEVKKILETSCYDCHSDHTNYPWYTNIQPVGWWLASHVSDGKDEVNFSQFKGYRIKRQMRKFKEIAKQLEEDEMPLNSYLWIHGNAKLDAAQKTALGNWAKENQTALEQQYPDSVTVEKKRD